MLNNATEAPIPTRMRAAVRLQGVEIGLDGYAIRRGIEAPQIIRVACDDGIPALPGYDHHRSVDDIRRLGGATKFATGTGNCSSSGMISTWSLRKNRAKET